MVEEGGLILRTDSGFAWIETERRSSCSNCVARVGCGGGALARVLGRRRTVVRALDPLGAQPGEQVVIGLEERALVTGSIAVYLLPLIALLIGAAAASFVAPDRDLYAAAGGGVGFTAALFYLRWFGAKVHADPRFQPVVLRRASDFPVANGSAEAPSRLGELQ